MKHFFLISMLVFLLIGQRHYLLASTKTDSLLTGASINGLLHADTTTMRPIRPVDDEANPIWRVLWITLVLLAFLLSGMLAYKKFVLKGSINRSAQIAVLARQPIAPKQSILIVRIEDKKYALGATDHSLNVIAELGMSAPDEAVAEDKPLNLFGDVLKKITKR